MKVAIDTRSLMFAKTGLKTYLNELVNAWQLVPNSNLVLLSPTKKPYSGNNKLLKIIEHINYFWWKQVQLPRLALKNNCTHLFCADFFVPFKIKWISKDLKMVAVLHDAFFWESPEHYNPIWLKIFHLFGVPAAKKADLLITDTQFSKDRILAYENFNSNIFIVVHAAAKTLPYVEDGTKRLKSIHPNLTPQKYFLHVGVLEKRKNLTTLIEAFSEVHKIHLDYKLVLVGNKSFKKNLDDEANIIETIRRLNLKESIFILGYLEVEDLASIYQSAFAYVFPSLNEGFGLPVLEAFNALIPLISANNSCLPEVAGDAAVYFNPYHVNELSQCMQELIDDPAMVLALKEKGKNRLNQFSWSKTAITIQKALENI
jgi:glycosyltransferase involved in cell wall biosynthesis